MKNPTALLAAALLAATLSGCAGAAAADPATTATANPVTPTPAATASEPPATVPAPTSTALTLLETLPVRGRAPKTGYSRDQFGDGWKDPDRNGCDTRNDILARDMPDEVKDGPCKVVSGTVFDPYTGKTIAFIRGNDTSMAVQIDHRVPLSNAWQTGAQQLSFDQRVQLANDPLNLIAVDGPTNGQKSDGDAATWMPPQRGYWCEYVTAQVQVKAKYGLWVTQPEKDAIVRALGTCTGGEGVDVGVTIETQPPVEVVPAPAPAPAPGAEASYANCDAVRAAGAAPIHAGDPGYTTKLDRDGDGTACE
ncbi:excalibur calcium-binding domain-containing protein [Agromyces humi]|uniref:excalibur calcium-binding domain-containing protein n=1 Tax=Agromyces humi TaxID=1766800 RepID=UPI001F31C6B9|nr:excalibur calcium-binding domain-containing protein [Agromyces humi]